MVRWWPIPSRYPHNRCVGCGNWEHLAAFCVDNTRILRNQQRETLNINRIPTSRNNAFFARGEGFQGGFQHQGGFQGQNQGGFQDTDGFQGSLHDHESFNAESYSDTDASFYRPYRRRNRRRHCGRRHGRGGSVSHESTDRQGNFGDAGGFDQGSQIGNVPPPVVGNVSPLRLAPVIQTTSNQLRSNAVMSGDFVSVENPDR